ncbi:MAG: SLC13 family permease [Nitrososphaeria archaeon]
MLEDFRLVPVAVLIVVYVLIAKRSVFGRRVEIWMAMGIGAALMLLSGSISPYEALLSENIHVLIYLVGVLLIGAALNESGLLMYYFRRLFEHEESFFRASLKLFLLIGLLSAVLMNDTLAIIMTPLMVEISKRLNINEKFLLLMLAFAVTIGSVMTPIGNPQNLIIGLQMQNAFFYFAKYLALPTLVNLLVTYYLLGVFFRSRIPKRMNVSSLDYNIKDERLAFLSKLSIVLLFALSVLNAALFFLVRRTFSLDLIALVSAFPVLLSRSSVRVLKRFDWKTIAFFVFMFIVMQAVYNSGFFQSFALGLFNNPVNIMFISIVLSQFLSNVPFVDLFVRFAGSSPINLVTLAAGSTIAGNFLVLGAASNIIIIQTAEDRGGEGLSFMDFVKYGTATTLVNAAIYLFFIYLQL